MTRKVPFLLVVIALAWTTVPATFADPAPTPRIVERVTTKAPFPRGLVMLEGDLYVLCRGRVRGAGGVTAEIDDQAGTLYVVDPNVTQDITDDPDAEVREAVRNNGTVFARPSDPPFKLWDRASTPPEADRRTDRPYCGLRYHEPTKSFYICAFSGVDMPRQPGERSFSKNLTDALLRYDTRTKRWYELERHDPKAGGTYPHHDPERNPPPHGWLNGPDNLLILGNTLYAVAKDNSRLVKYDLTPLIDDPEAGPAESEVVLHYRTWMKGDDRPTRLYGHSALAYRDGYLYVGTRTSSVIFRIALDDNFQPVDPIVAEVVARFDPFDPDTGRSADVTDIAFDEQARLYVISAKPSRVYRFTPDPADVYDARNGREKPWADMASLTDNPRMKSENLLYHAGWLYVTSGDGYGYQEGADGTVYRVKVED